MSGEGKGGIYGDGWGELGGRRQSDNFGGGPFAHATREQFLGKAI